MKEQKSRIDKIDKGNLPDGIYTIKLWDTSSFGPGVYDYNLSQQTVIQKTSPGQLLEPGKKVRLLLQVEGLEYYLYGEVLAISYHGIFLIPSPATVKRNKLTEDIRVIAWKDIQGYTIIDDFGEEFDTPADYIRQQRKQGKNTSTTGKTED